ncbi:hypothetical protein PR048_000274 [Dryococelus australis]|uniref:Uncharacterized protein n=1 Tax=Dryococelus australis TaxID=614101 RepID=A0ABQ9IF26_9NEOP|nr:hypothetical protein PR048_000274 [Dryococelus australis]
MGDVGDLRKRILAGCGTIRDRPGIHQHIQLSMQRRIEACLKTTFRHCQLWNKIFVTLLREFFSQRCFSLSEYTPAPPPPTHQRPMLLFRGRSGASRGEKKKRKIKTRVQRMLQEFNSLKSRRRVLGHTKALGRFWTAMFPVKVMVCPRKFPNNELLRAGEGEMRQRQSSTGMLGRRETGDPRENRTTSGIVRHHKPHQETDLISVIVTRRATGLAIKGPHTTLQSVTTELTFSRRASHIHKRTRIPYLYGLQTLDHFPYTGVLANDAMAFRRRGLVIYRFHVAHICCEFSSAIKIITISLVNIKYARSVHFSGSFLQSDESDRMKRVLEADECDFEVSVVERRNERAAGETRDPRGNPPTNSIVKARFPHTEISCQMRVVGYPTSTRTVETHPQLTKGFSFNILVHWLGKGGGASSLFTGRLSRSQRLRIRPECQDIGALLEEAATPGPIHSLEAPAAAESDCCLQTADSDPPSPLLQPLYLILTRLSNPRPRYDTACHPSMRRGRGMRLFQHWIRDPIDEVLRGNFTVLGRDKSSPGICVYYYTSSPHAVLKAPFCLARGLVCTVFVMHVSKQLNVIHFRVPAAQSKLAAGLSDPNIPSIGYPREVRMEQRRDAMVGETGESATLLRRVGTFGRFFTGCITPYTQIIRFGVITEESGCWEAVFRYNGKLRNNICNVHDIICTAQHHDGYTERLERRSDEALGVRVTVVRIAPSHLDLGRAATYEVSMEQRRNARAGGNGRSPSKTCRFALLRGKQANPATAAPKTSQFLPQKLLASCHRNISYSAVQLPYRLFTLQLYEPVMTQTSKMVRETFTRMNDHWSLSFTARSTERKLPTRAYCTQLSALGLDGLAKKKFFCLLLSEGMFVFKCGKNILFGGKIDGQHSFAERTADVSRQNARATFLRRRRERNSQFYLRSEEHTLHSAQADKPELSLATFPCCRGGGGGERKVFAKWCFRVCGQVLCSPPKAKIMAGRGKRETRMEGGGYVVVAVVRSTNIVAFSAASSSLHILQDSGLRTLNSNQCACTRVLANQVFCIKCGCPVDQDSSTAQSSNESSVTDPLNSATRMMMGSKVKYKEQPNRPVGHVYGFDCAAHNFHSCAHTINIFATSKKKAIYVACAPSNHEDWVSHRLQFQRSRLALRRRIGVLYELAGRLSAESLVEARYRRLDCTPVQCFARRGDERIDAHVSVAPNYTPSHLGTSGGNRAGRCHYSAGSLGIFRPPPRPFAPALLHALIFTLLIGSQDLDVKSSPNLYTHSLRASKGRRRTRALWWVAEEGKGRWTKTPSGAAINRRRISRRHKSAGCRPPTPSSPRAMKVDRLDAHASESRMFAPLCRRCSTFPVRLSHWEFVSRSVSLELRQRLISQQRRMKENVGGGGRELLRAQRADVKGSRFETQSKRGGKTGELGENTPRPAASPGTTPTCQNPGAIQAGIEPGSPKWEVGSLATTPPWPQCPDELRRSFSPCLNIGQISCS